VDTTVGIIGAGPAGLTLAHLLAAAGIESVVLEDRSRAHVEQRIRAGVLEQPTVDLLDGLGVAERMHRVGLVHHGIEIRFDGQRHRIALSDLTGGKAITIYGQQELVKDLIAARLAAGDPILFDVEDVRLDGVETELPTISFRADGREERLRCVYIAGCDGFHGISRPTIPAGVLRTYEREYPFAWLGILAAVAPSTEELIYASHDRGFALHSLRSPSISRLYLQVDPDEDLRAWSDDRIWSELRVRLGADGWTLADGPILDRSVTPLRSFVVEPMQYGRLFLAGDAAHIVPATGAKGLNLAVSDVRALAEAIVLHQETGDRRGLDAYTSRCLRRIWRVQDFSWWMSAMLHRLPDDDGFAGRLRRAQLEWLVSSESAARSLAENYVGLPFS
jgi:p-hydroxybenzoate 3-monooxygenase